MLRSSSTCDRFRKVGLLDGKTVGIGSDHGQLIAGRQDLDAGQHGAHVIT